ncbi:MAG: hypothetical protein ACYCVB_11585 [Bacilli bacterium]
MAESKLLRLLTTPFLIVYALWAVLFYQLAFTAWTLEYSVLGVLFVLIASVAFIYAFPRGDRKVVIRFTLFCVMTSVGIASFASEPLAWRVIDFIVFLALALILGRFLISVKTRRLFFVIVAITLLQVWVPLGDLSTLAYFDIRYIGHLASPDSQVSSLPVAAVSDPARPGLQEIVTLRGHAPVKSEAQSLINLANANPAHAASILSALKNLQRSYDVIAVRPGRLRLVTHYATAAELKQLPFSSLGLVNFPFTTSHFLTVANHTRMYLSLSASPGTLLSMLLSPATVATSIADLGLQTAATEQRNWRNVTGHTVDQTAGLAIQNGYLTGVFHGAPVHFRTGGVAILGVHRMLPPSVSSGYQAVVEGNNTIQVVALPPAKPRVIATLHGSYLHPLTMDVVFADLTGNHQDALLVNTVPAQIFQLSPAGAWQRLWVSGRDSFRFETAFKRPGGDLLIVNSPSLMNAAKTRYLGGYVYRSGQLVRVFRVYHGNFVDLHTVHVTSTSQPELLTSVYSHQEIMMLGPQVLPWMLLVEAGFGLTLIVGVVRRFKGRRSV